MAREGQNNMKLITAGLLEGWSQAENKVAYTRADHATHPENITTPVHAERGLEPPNITEITSRNQANTDKYEMHLLPNRWSSRLGRH